MGLGDYAQEQFSDEERAALGETPEMPPAQAPAEKEAPEKAPESPEAGTEEKAAEATAAKPAEKATETAPAAQPPESAPDDSQEKVDPVQKRIDRLTWEKNEQDRKLTLLKTLGRDKYFEVYPDERPAGYQPQQPAGQPPPAAPEPSYQEVARMIVQGGAYNGRTLGDLIDSADPAERLAGIDLLTEHKAAAREEAAKAESVRKSYAEAAQKEVNAFEYNLARTTFGKDKDFTPEEVGQIRSVSAQVIAWMQTPDPVTGRSRVAYSVSDAYFIMNRDGLLKEARTRAAQAAVEAVTKPGVKSIGPGDSGAKLTGYEAYLAMSDDSLAKAIDKMTEPEFRKFCRDAPRALKDKHPSLTWG